MGKSDFHKRNIHLGLGIVFPGRNRGFLETILELPVARQAELQNLFEIFKFTKGHLIFTP
jgi:hypothetical protein